MKYFTRGWANGELTEDEASAVGALYLQRLAAVAPHLPDPMHRLAHAIALHDAVIEEVLWHEPERQLTLSLVASTLEGQPLAVDIVYRDALLGVQRIDALRRAARDRETQLLYHEVDVADDGVLVHRILFWPCEEVTLEFRAITVTTAPRTDRRVRLLGAFRRLP